MHRRSEIATTLGALAGAFLAPQGADGRRGSHRSPDEPVIALNRVTSTVSVPSGLDVRMRNRPIFSRGSHLSFMCYGYTGG